MGGFPGFWQIVIVVVLVILLFGRGKISDLMGDVAKGIKSFKKGISDDDAKDKADKPNAPLADKREATAAPVSDKEKVNG